MSQQLGDYRLDRLLGRGGMGEVFRAWDGRRARWVALKLLAAQLGTDPAFVRRFHSEARIAGRLTNAHVVPVHDFGEIDGRLFLDMRLVEGPDLSVEIERHGRIAPGRTVHLLTQVASALDAAHDVGLVHRDVKPSNVLVGPEDFVYVADFGLARSRGPLTTASGELIGTLAYLAPERLRGEPAEVAADVYALGCVLYECLTGQRAFPGDDMPALIAAHLHGDPPAPSEVDPRCAPFDTVVVRALAKDPAHRFASAGEMATAMSRALRRTTSEDPPHPGSTTRRPPLPPTCVQDAPPGTETHPSGRTIAPARRPAGRLIEGVWWRWALSAALVVLLALLVILSRWYVGDGVAVGLSPVAVTVSKDGASVLVVNAGSSRVTVLDARTRTVTGTVDLREGALAATSDATTDRLFVVTDRNALIVIDTRTAAIVTKVPLGERPKGRPAVAAGAEQVWVPRARDIALVDLRAGRVVRSAPGVAPHPVAVEDRVALVLEGSTTVTVLDARTGAPLATATLPAPATDDAAVAADGRLVLGTEDPAKALVEIDVRSGAVTDTVALPAPPMGLAVSGNRAYVAVGAPTPWMAILDLRTGRVAGRAFVEPFASRVAVATGPGGSPIYIANNDLGTLTIDDQLY